MDQQTLKTFIQQRNDQLKETLPKIEYIVKTPFYLRRNVRVVRRLSAFGVTFGLSYAVQMLPDYDIGLPRFLHHHHHFVHRLLYYLAACPLLLLFCTLLGNYIIARYPNILISHQDTRQLYSLDRLIEPSLERYRLRYRNSSQSPSPSTLSPAPTANQEPHHQQENFPKQHSKSSSSTHRAPIAIEPAFSNLDPQLQSLILEYKLINAVVFAYLPNSYNLYKFPEWRNNSKLVLPPSLLKKQQHDQSKLVRRFVPIHNTEPLLSSISPPHPVVLEHIDQNLFASLASNSSTLKLTAKPLRHRHFLQIKNMINKGLYGYLPPHAFIRPLTLDDLDQCAELEASGFTPEQRASRETLAYRLRTCPELSSGLFIREYEHDTDSFYYNPTFAGLPYRALADIRIQSYELAQAEDNFRRIDEDWKKKSQEYTSEDEWGTARADHVKVVSQAEGARSRLFLNQQRMCALEEKFAKQGYSDISLAPSDKKPTEKSQPKAAKTGEDEEDEDEDDIDEEEEKVASFKRLQYQAVKATPVKERLIAHIFATKTLSPTITERCIEVPKVDEYNRTVPEDIEAGRGHFDSGRFVVVHSLVVSSEYRGKGIGSTLMTDYAQKLSTVSAGDLIVLLAEEANIPFYEKLGFEDWGISECKHGNTEWHSMGKHLFDPDEYEYHSR